MARKQRHNVGLWAATAGLVALLLLLACSADWFTQATPLRGAGASDHFRDLLLKLFGTALFFGIGASLGSFLNVVVYRMPRGVSINGSSACPNCTTPIRFQDNVPVLAWFALHGRCRTCRLPISPRYPLVEFVTGVVFVVLMYAEFASGVRNLPLGPRYPYNTGFLWLNLETKWDLIRLYCYHALLLWSLLAVALIQEDGQRIPGQLWLFVASLGFAVPLIWQDIAWKVHYVSDQDPLTWNDRAGYHLLGMLCGMTLGMGIEWVLARLPSGPISLTRPRLAVTGSLALVGLFLGWQPAIWVAIMGLLFHGIAWLACRVTARTPVPLALSLWVATFIQIVLWRRIAATDWWPDSVSMSKLLVG